MRTAVISDVHGNLIGLEAVLADLRRSPADQVMCLGDMVQGGAQPAQTVARLREMKYPIVMGNADAWLLSGVDIHGVEGVSEKQLAVREWSLEQLSDADRQFISSFRPTIQLSLGNSKSLLCFHGSPRSFDDVILPETPEEEFQRLLGEFQSFVLTGGHTHMQHVRRLGDSFFFNPGSAGLAYNRHLPEDQFHADAWAEYAVLTTEAGQLSLDFRRVPLKVNELIHAIRASGRPFAEEAASQYAPPASAPV